MAKRNNENMVKARLLVLTRMFQTLTDESNPMDTFQIIDYLAEHGVPANTKTLRSDIALLKEMDIDIVTVSGRPNKYFMGARLFEMPELKLLIDATQSSRFITRKKSTELIRKLTSLASVNQQKQLSRHVYSTWKIKPKNESIYYFVDLINTAIEKHRKISFNIIEYDGSKNEVLRGDGETYVMSPYAMYWNDDFYYVVGWSDKRQCMAAYRIDRMKNPKLLSDRSAKKPTGFKITDYSSKVFEMFDGEEVTAKLECKNKLMKYVIDRFGMKVKTESAGDDAFYCYPEVRLSPTFYGWVFGFGGDIEILEPEEAVEEIVAMADRIKNKTL